MESSNFIISAIQKNPFPSSTRAIHLRDRPSVTFEIVPSFAANPNQEFAPVLRELATAGACGPSFSRVDGLRGVAHVIFCPIANEYRRPTFRPALPSSAALCLTRGNAFPLSGNHRGHTQRTRPANLSRTQDTVFRDRQSCWSFWRIQDSCLSPSCFVANVDDVLAVAKVRISFPQCSAGVRSNSLKQHFASRFYHKAGRASVSRIVSKIGGYCFGFLDGHGVLFLFF